MERDFEEGDKQKNQKLTVLDPDLLDLRETIAMNCILERLELVDYIRFSAVCKKWLSIQKEHRIRNSPYPPPMRLPFPWLRCLRCLPYGKEVEIVFHLPDKQKTYNIPLPKPYGRRFTFDYKHGWQILFLDNSLCISNPITGVQIELPPLPELVLSSYHVLPICHPPFDPDCTVIIMDNNGKAHLNRLNSNSGWKTIQRLTRYWKSSVFCRNKIYFTENCKRVWMIDTLPSDLVEQMIEMDCSEISAFERARFRLVDYFGELVTVASIREELIGNCDIKEIEVYKADFSMNKWVRMESLGEYALFLSSGSRFSISAVDVGCKKDTIYLTGGLMNCKLLWRAFDLSTRDWIDGPAASVLCDHRWIGSCSWFLPTLDYFGVDKRNGACQIQSG